MYSLWKGTEFVTYLTTNVIIHKPNYYSDNFLADYNCSYNTLFA